MTRERTTVLKTPKKGFIDYWFFAFDWHTEAMHVPTYNILRKHARKITPKSRRKLGIGGDFLDCEHLMLKDAPMKKAAKSIDRIEELIALSEIEFQWGNDRLDELEKDFSEIVYICGNHEARYFKWLKFCPPEYAHNFDPIKQLRLKERGIKFIHYPDYLDIGHLTITHGYKHGQNHNDEVMKIVNCSILYGHVHHYNCKSYAHRGESKRATSAPCMSDLAPEYQRKRGENNWSTGYLIAAMRSNGIFNLYCFEPWENQLVLPCGTVLNG